MQVAITGPRRIVVAGLLVTLLGLVLLSFSLSVSMQPSTRIGTSSAPSAVPKAGPILVPRRYLPLEWNGTRRPVTLDHMFRSDRPRR